jgi:hypothetical protein
MRRNLGICVRPIEGPFGLSRAERNHTFLRWQQDSQSNTCLTADIVCESDHVRNVPDAEVLSYSITSSALAKSEGGTDKPIDPAALRLIVSLNREGCSTGRSAGFAPFNILSVYAAARRK